MTSSTCTRPGANLQALATLSLAWTLLSCASPGPPRPPSLGLPEPVRDLSAERVGSTMVLRFTVPRDATDGRPLRGGTALGTLCRAEGPGPCRAFVGGPSFQSFTTREGNGAPHVVTLRDDLDGSLQSGAPRLLRYEVEFFNAARRSDGASAPVFAVAGEPLAPVTDLRANGTRGGIVLSWAATHAGAPGEVLLHRETVGQATTPAAKARSRTIGLGGTEESGAVWLQANGGPLATRTLDGSAAIGQGYRYTAQRRQTVQIAGHALEMRSELSAPVLFTLPDTFAPAAPANLTAAGFGDSAQYGVDLIWEPVDDPGVVGYLVSRAAIGAEGAPQGPLTSLTPKPVTSPAFHDKSADPRLRYRYEVIAVDTHGNRSSAASVTVDPLLP